MKKLLVLMCILLLGIEGFADDMYLFKGTVIQDKYNQKVKKSKSVINLPETKPYSLITNNDTKELQKAGAEALMLGVSTTAGIIASTMFSGSLVLDPYVFQIQDKQYVLVKDKTKGKYSSNDLVGIQDSKHDRFNSLIKLDKNGDGRVTGEEMRNAKIRLVQVSQNGALIVKSRQKDFNLNYIDYIDLKTLRKNANSEETGIFGHFNIYLKNFSQNMAVGYVTYDSKEDLNILFE